MIIGIDFDGTLFDIQTPWLAEHNRRYNGEVTLDDWLEFSNIVGLRCEFADFLRLRSPEMYAEATVIAGAQQAVAQLAEQHTLVCITSDTARFVPVKKRLLREHFPEIEHMVFSHNKRAVAYDILIDDAVHKSPDILLAQPWNATYPLGMLRVRSWDCVVPWVDGLL